MPPLPTPEALTLAANVFHADVDAWLPSDFGVTRSLEDKEAEWAEARSLGALRGGDRLGLGHPDLDDPEARRTAQVSRAGGDILRKVVGKKRPLSQEDAAASTFSSPSSRREGDEDDESRTKAVSSKKRRVVDAFGKGKGTGKKGAAAAVHPLLNLKNPIPGYDAPAAPAVAKKVEKKGRKEVDDSVNEAAALAASLSSTSVTMSVVTKASAASLSPKVGATLVTTSAPASSVAASETNDQEDKGAEGGMSKAALRREKRKRAKAAKKVAE